MKHLVELHGGTVEARSEGAGKGATFVIRLPVAPVRPSSAAPQPSAVPAPTLTFPSELRGLEVLVLDDEADVRELVKEVLEQAGVRVRVATSAADALAIIGSGPKPDVIVSDIGMPGEDGYTFIRRLRALSREDGGRIPAIALTAYARAEDRRKALLAGFQNHAAKPVEPQELMIVVANLAGRFA